MTRSEGPSEVGPGGPPARPGSSGGPPARPGHPGRPARPGSPGGPPVLLFDGVCNLCNGAVDFVARRDRSGRFRFAALQSEAARAVLEEAGGAELLPGPGEGGSTGHSAAAAAPGARPGDSGEAYETFLLVEHGRVWDRSSAALRVARGLGFPYALLTVFTWVPRPLRDAVYTAVARRRYRWFGQRDTCRVPTEAERARFL